MVGAKQIKENAELNYHDELSFLVSIAALSLPPTHDSGTEYPGQIPHFRDTSYYGLEQILR